MPLNITDEKLQALQDAPEADRTKFFDSLQQDERDQLFSAVQDWKARKSQPQAAPTAPEKPAPETSLLGAIGRNFLGGYTANHSDEGVGAISTLDPSQHGGGNVHGAAYKMPDGSVRFMDTPDETEKVRTEEQRQLLRGDMEHHPIASVASNIGGSLALDMTLKGLGVPGVGTLPYQMAMGALAGEGAADDKTPGGKMGGAAIGAGTALVGHGLGKYVVGPLVSGAGKALSKYIPDSVRKFAAMRTLNAAGYNKNDLKPIIRADPEEAIRRGQTLFNEGVVQPGRTVENVAERTEEALDKYGKAIGAVLDTADATGAKFDMGAFVNRARKEILGPMMVNGKVDPAFQKEAAALNDLLTNYEAVGPTGFAAANQMKSNLQRKVNFGNNWNNAVENIPNELRKDLQRVFLNEVDDQLGSQLTKAGAQGQEIKEAFKLLKSRYGTLVDAEDKARTAMAGQNGNNFFSGGDKFLGGSIAGGGITSALMNGEPGKAALALGLGLGTSVASKLGRERGMSTLATAANGLSHVLDIAAASTPMKWLVKAPTQQLAKYAGPLTAAAAKGPTALATTIFVLAQQSPEFRQMQEDAKKNAD